MNGWVMAAAAAMAPPNEANAKKQTSNGTVNGINFILLERLFVDEINEESGKNEC